MFNFSLFTFICDKLSLENCGRTDKFLELQSASMKEAFSYSVHLHEHMSGQYVLVCSLFPISDIRHTSLSVVSKSFSFSSSIKGWREQSHINGLPVKRKVYVRANQCNLKFYCKRIDTFNSRLKISKS